MGLYNIVMGQMICPRCHQLCQVEVETRLGDVSQVQTLHVGDCYPWPQNRRPPRGNANGEGYCECPICGKDFFVWVQVASDEIVSLQVDPNRAGYIPD
ncbi:MAG: hypothetical protein KDA84_00685 [Planctomycetaceae bacterium]|nr:hypothetical protein [Planctomycetaceae bacterium]